MTDTVKKKETLNNKYETLIEKHKNVEPLPHRLRQKTEKTEVLLRVLK